LKPQVRIELGFALSAIVLGLYLLIGSSGINLGSGYDRIGPRFFPYLIAIGLLLSAGMMVIESVYRRQPPRQVSIELLPLSVLLFALVLSVLLLERLGFVLTVTLLFTLVARAFKSQRYVRDIIIGLLLAVTVYYIFTTGLGLVLPRGILNGLL
jgi:putative tricarboxylic transport membrane protein